MCIGESLLDGSRQAAAADEIEPDPPAVLLMPAIRWPWSHAIPLLLAVLVLLVATSAPTTPRSTEGGVPAGTVPLRPSQREGDGSRAAQLGPLAPPDEINLEAIVELLGWDDALAALQQAESWQQVLRDFGIDDSDARMTKLAEVIEKLRQRTKTTQVQPPCIAEFRKQLQALRNALKAKDLAAARAAIARLDGLFRKNQEHLAHYGRSLLTLKARYEQLVRIQEGPAAIRRILEQANQELGRNQPTAAAEALGKAKFLTLGTPVKDEEFATIDAEVRRIDRELRFVRGKAAVAAAKECVSLKDGAARDAMVRLALDLLPDLPDELWQQFGGEAEKPQSFNSLSTQAGNEERAVDVSR